MSGTRLHLPKAPATEARPTQVFSPASSPVLLLVAHGERGGAGNDRLAHDLAARLSRSGRYRSVHSCFISKEPTLANVFAGLPPGPVIIYPLFMSDGYFVRRAIPRSLASARKDNGLKTRPIQTTAPFGLSPYLPGLIAELAQDTALENGRAPRDCRLLLVAHGSRHDKASREATLRIADTLDRTDSFAGIESSFLEEEPFLDDRIATIGGPAIIVGLFAGQGMHGAVDLPGAVNASGRSDIFLAAPLAQSPDLLNVIQEDLNRSADGFLLTNSFHA